MTIPYETPEARNIRTKTVRHPAEPNRRRPTLPFVDIVMMPLANARVMQLATAGAVEIHMTKVAPVMGGRYPNMGAVMLTYRAEREIPHD